MKRLRLIVPLIVLGLAGWVIFLALKTASPQNQSSSAPTTTPSQSESKSSVANELNLLYLQKNEAATQIIKISADGKTKKVVFTDRDETLKIKTARSITTDGRVLVLLGTPDQPFAGTLFLISTDGKGTKEKIFDNFASPQPAAISPDGKKVAYIVFSNVEQDFGFSINVSNIDGTNKRELARDPAALFGLAWSSDGADLHYIRGLAPKGSAIEKVNLESQKITRVATLENRSIYSLSIAPNQYYFVDGVGNSAEIYRINLDGREETQVSKDTINQNYPVLSTDGLYLAYYEADLSADTATQEGKITVEAIKDQSKNVVGSGESLIGWLEN